MFKNTCIFYLQQELNLFVEKDGLVSHLFKEARRHVQSSTDEFRLLEIVGYKVFRIVPGDQPLDQLTPQAQRSYRLEVKECIHKYSHPLLSQPYCLLLHLLPSATHL